MQMGIGMEKAYKLEFKNQNSGELYLNTCGCSQTEPLHSFGPAVRPHFLIHFVLSGAGKFVVGGQEYPLKAGYGFLIEPNELTFYQADANKPWTYIWVGFSGSQAEEFLRKVGLSTKHPVFESDQSEELYETVKDMMEHNTYSMSNDIRRNGLLRVFLSIISENAMIPEKEEAENGNYYVHKAIEYIRSNYYTPIKITDVANYVCINRSYLYTLFKNSLDMTPQEFLSLFRITKAVQLLAVTSLSIESIAISCGYSDPLVFAKAFRKLKGLSPSTFIKDILKGESRRPYGNLQQIEDFIRDMQGQN